MDVCPKCLGKGSFKIDRESCVHGEFTCTCSNCRYQLKHRVNSSDSPTEALSVPDGCPYCGKGKDSVCNDAVLQYKVVRQDDNTVAVTYHCNSCGVSTTFCIAAPYPVNNSPQPLMKSSTLDAWLT